MWNPFKTSPPDSVRSSGAAPAEYGFPSEHLDTPFNTVVLDDANYPDEPNQDTNSPSSWRSNTGELWPSSHPEYDRPYRRHIDNTPGPTADAGWSVAPAIGSTDLAFPRDQGGVPGTNTLIGGEGPVTGEDYANWTGQRTALHTPAIGNAGPVVGGPDYSSQLAAAFFQQQAAQYSREYADSAMVSAV